MRLRFTTSIAGAHYSFKPGDETEWPNDAEARRLVEAGFAVPVRSVAIETADARTGVESADATPVAETAARPPEDAEQPPANAGGTKGTSKKGTSKKGG